MTREVGKIVEAVLFLADEPLPASDLAVLLEMPVAEVETILGQLAETYEREDRGIVVRKVAGGWRLATHPSAAPYLERFVSEHRYAKMSQAALETLAVIAYRQPVSRQQLAEIRGVSCDSVVRTLLARGVVQEMGRDSGPGQAVLYGTTLEFLERMGLESLEDLPSLPEFMPDSEAVERMESGLGPGV